MPRQARKKSNTGIYHIMHRGINQQQIFEDSEDYEKFIQVLNDCKAISKYKLFAYCLMGNHLHLLIQEDIEPIEQVMKRITNRFVYWYNIKYRRVGHLFQDRFKSEPVEDEAYFLTVLRYIHQNPIKAEICKGIDEYPYSSYNEILQKNDLIDYDYIFSIIDQKPFIEFNNQATSKKCMDVTEKTISKVTDEKAKKIISKYSKCDNPSEFQNMDIKLRDKYLRKFREKGLSIRQISRLTGISFNVVRKFQ